MKILGAGVCLTGKSVFLAASRKKDIEEIKLLIIIDNLFQYQSQIDFPLI